MNAKTLSGRKIPDARNCPHCGYLNERPHAAVCLRCNGLIPGVAGCSSCGACRSGD